MKANRIVRVILIFVVLAANIGCDQISKSVVRQRVDYYEQISIVKNYLTLTKVENSGAFLSLGSTLPDSVRFILLSVLPLILIGIGLGYLFLKSGLPKATMLGFAFVLGGGIGNIYDRLAYGSVTDFLHIDFVIFQTGIFNMADVSVLTGVLIVFISSFSKEVVANQSEQ